MRVRVLAFASAADALGARAVEIELPAGSRASDLGELLASEHPALGELWPRLALAIDGSLAGPEAAIPDGAEVALLPPVSGGGRPRARLVDGPIEIARVAEEVAGGGRGALVLFVGRVRDSTGGRPVTGLTYDAYRPMAEAALERIAADLEGGAAGLEVAIVHRLGEVGVGEASVAIAVASPHRGAAYEASRTALERLKTEVPIWKCERFADGEARWREAEPLRSPVRA